MEQITCKDCKHSMCVDRKKQTFYCIPPDNSKSRITFGENTCEKGEKK